MADVRMPDGTIIRNVPAGAKRADIERAWQKARQAKAVPDKRPASHTQGLYEGVTNAAGNALNYLERAPMLQIPSAVASTVMNTILGKQAPSQPGMSGRPQPSVSGTLRRERDDLMSKSSSRGSKAGRIIGEIAATLPTAFGPGGALLQGALGGGLVTENPNDTMGVVRDTAIGGVAGKAGQLFGKRVVAPVAERVGRTAPVRKLGEAAARAVKRAPLPLPNVTRAERNVLQATREGKPLRKVPNLVSVRQNIADAAEYGRPYALADANPQLQTLAGSVARYSPNARTMAQEALTSRADDQGYRAIQDISDYLHPPTDVKRVSEGIRQAAQRKSNPLYEKAFEGGSIAPLETQLDDAFNQASRAVSDAGAELAAAQRALTVSKAGVNRAGNNVYSNASALPADRQAQAAVAAAQRKVADAQAGRDQVLEMLRRSQSDASANAPGAIWSPRIQQFLDDPISKQGLARGVEIQRLEALAQGKPFNPTELAITGADEAGNPLVTGVPNMRTLDAVKKGLDALIDDYPKDFKGNPILDERGRAVTQVLKSFRGTVDDLNPDYADARGVYQQYIQPRDALNRGFASTGKNVPSRDLDKIIAGYNPKEMAQFRAGYATNLTDQVAGAADSADPYKLIAGGINRREKLGTLYPEGAPKLNRIRELEGQMSATRNEVLGGSQTQPRAIADQGFQNGLGELASDAAMDVASSGMPGLQTIAKAGLRASLGDKRRLGLFGAQQKADELAPILFDTSNPNGLLDYISQLSRKLEEEQLRKQAYGRVGGLLGIPLAPGVVSSGR